MGVPSLEELVRRAAWQAVGIPYDLNSPFQNYARAQDLGCPLTDEVPIDLNTRAQGFALGIVFGRAGEKLEHVGWQGEAKMNEDMVAPAIAFGSPFQAVRISQPFGVNEDWYKKFSYNGVPLKGHTGIDFAVPSGTLVEAVSYGNVIEIGFEPTGYGRYVKLEHEWGESLYAHISEIQVGYRQSVVQGQPIALSGNTGNSTGPHLHFAVRFNPYRRDDGWGGFSDPLPSLPIGSFFVPTGYTRSLQSTETQPRLPGMVQDGDV